MRKRHESGFTLIELMIVAGIIAIIAAVAYPAYTAQVKQTRQTEMQGYLTDLSASLEAYRTQNFSYDGATVADLNTNAANSNHYNVQLNILNAGTAYELTATPINQQQGAGHMMRDSQGRTCVDKTSDTSCDLTDITQRWSK
ncbi:MAG: type IV pilin protein [Alcanivoracaceae bacterium]|jgi:type IV pilus assembly protein PilE|nr:type IV pilin protein [Alcanivoracaceae bacterium]